MIMNSTLTIANKVVEDKDINFYDYDGTLLYSWSLNELQEKTELPPNPYHPGLIAQGWNWTLEKLKEENESRDVGQMVVTSDDCTRLYLDIPNNLSESSRTVPIRFTQSVSNGIEIDWGDGSVKETISGSGSVTKSHLYQSGKYCITLKRQSGTITFGSYSYGGIFSNKGITKHSILLYKAELGSSYIDDHAFHGCINLKTINIPNGTSKALYCSFAQCWSLKCLIIPTSLLNFASFGLNQLTRAEIISLPWNFIDGGENYSIAFGFSLKRFMVPNNCILGQGSTESFRKARERNIPSIMTVIPHTFANESYALLHLKIPSNITTISNRAFSELVSLSDLRFNSINPPTVTNANNWSNMNTNCIVFIPYDSTAYLTATNYPSPATYLYLGYNTFTEGATLPTAPTDTGYTLTWYASPEDARSQTSPITTGNGSEVYCRYTEVV